MMKHSLSIHVLTCTAVLGTAALSSAQTTPPPPQPPQQTAPAPQPSADSIIVTGCLRSASSGPDVAGTAGTTGTAGSTATGTAGTAGDPSQQKFVLTDATRGAA